MSLLVQVSLLRGGCRMDLRLPMCTCGFHCLAPRCCACYHGSDSLLLLFCLLLHAMLANGTHRLTMRCCLLPAGWSHC